MSLAPLPRAVLAAAVALAAAAAVPAHAGPVTVTQTVSFASGVGPFGTFSTQAATLAGWSSAWPFTQASEIGTVTLSFTSTDRFYNDPALFPVLGGGGTPGVEVGFTDEATATRSAVASVTAAAPTIVLTSSAGAVYAALVASLLDGAVTFSLGGFVNYPNAPGGAFSVPASWDNGTLVVTVAGTVPDATVPEPGALALAGLALAAVATARTASRRRRAR